MKNYSIVALLEGHEDEIVDDILEQYKNKVADLALFCMTLVPTCDPPINKAKMLCEKYDRFSSRLKEKGADCGILVQASIGHGYILDELFPFQQVINLNDGKAEHTCCPYDKNFRAFFRNQMKTLAEHSPKMILVDDDFRLLGHAGEGCACPLHMAEFNRRSGAKLSRTELYDILKNHEHPKHEEYSDFFIDTQRDSLVGAAKEYRAGIDEVDPSIQGGYCTVAGEFCYEIAEVLSGKGKKIVLRINNGNYCTDSPKTFSLHMLRAAYQIKTATGKFDEILAETDTYPQNRYATSAQLLHAHFVGTLLEGATGAKHWLTRLNAYEPQSGESYRQKLAKYSGFYQAVAEMFPSWKPVGSVIPIPQKWGYAFEYGPWHKFDECGFACSLLERYGIPFYFSQEPADVVFFEGKQDRYYSDNQIKEFLSRNLYLTSEAADCLNKRGFGRYIGVEVRKWEGVHLSGEVMPNGESCAVQPYAQELVITDQNVKEDSFVYHLLRGTEKKHLFPGVTIFNNSLGGTVTVFCGTPKATHKEITAYSFLNEIRKKRIIEMLKSTSALPVYFYGDTEVYLRAFNAPDNKLICAVFNLSFDTLEEITLVFDKKPSKIFALSPKGKWQETTFTQDGEKTIINASATVLEVQVFSVTF